MGSADVRVTGAGKAWATNTRKMYSIAPKGRNFAGRAAFGKFLDGQRLTSKTREVPGHIVVYLLFGIGVRGQNLGVRISVKTLIPCRRECNSILAFPEHFA